MKLSLEDIEDAVKSFVGRKANIDYIEAGHPKKQNDGGVMWVVKVETKDDLDWLTRNEKTITVKGVKLLVGDGDDSMAARDKAGTGNWEVWVRAGVI